MQFQITPEKEKPDIDHITEEWGNIERTTQQTTSQEPRTAGTQGGENKPTISPDLQHIRDKAPLTQAMAAHPKINKWITEDYTEEEVETTIQKLKNNKSHGQDGIPERHIKHSTQWVVKPLTTILNEIKNRGELPPEWTQ